MTRIRARSSRRRSAPRDQGFAMMAALLVMLVVTGIAVTAITVTGNNLHFSRHAQDDRASLAAAQAGLDDYRRHLNANDTYWTNGGVDASNAALSGYEAVPGAASGAAYHYTVLTTAADTTQSGLIRVQSTGKVNGVSRTVTGDFRKVGFLKYGLFDVEETVDPSQYRDLGNNTSVSSLQASCGQPPASPKYYYSGRGGGCYDVYFDTNDVVDGPFHSNDAVLLNGHPTFTSPIAETSWPACNQASPTCYRQLSGGSSPNSSGFPLVYAAPLNFPPTNNAIRDAADPTTGGSGCLYTGPTQITLNSDGTMSVLSPYTVSANSGCATSLPMGNTAQTVPVPSNGVVYVQSIPASSTDPNYTDVPTCPAQELGNYPATGDDVTQNSAMPFDCHLGDAFVYGTLKGQLTIGAANNIYLVGNTTYAGGKNGTDVLGLVANNYVSVFHPVECNGQTDPRQCTDLGVWTNGNQPLHGITVDAAILSLQHNFTMQNFAYGHFLSTPGNTSTYRNVFGAVIEAFSALDSYGGQTGYNDYFQYDPRLLTLPPPYFLQPVAAPWSLVHVDDDN